MSRRRYDGRNGRDRYHGGHGGDTSAGGCLVLVVLALIAMPIAGLYLILRQDGDDGKKIIGWILLIIGVIFWIYIGVHSGR